MRKVIRYIICKCGFFYNKTEITGLILPTDFKTNLKEQSFGNEIFLKIGCVYLHILHFYKANIFNFLHVAPFELLRYT